jgi:hypothetical protein
MICIQIKISNYSRKLANFIIIENKSLWNNKYDFE